MEFESELAIAIDVVKDACELIRSWYARLSEEDISYKDDDSPLTRADTEANDHIVSELSSVFPRDGILSEETVDSSDRLENPRVWVIDPLDGTKEFIKKNGEFTVNVALVRDGQPVVGVIGVPAKHQLYYAVKGEGSFCIDASGESTRLSVSSVSKPSSMRLAKSRSHATDDLKRLISLLDISEVIASGSSVKGCLVASGDADAYVRLGDTHEWDICAMHLIVSEAGGVLTDLSGRIVLYNKEDTRINGFVVSNGKSHDDLISAISTL
ncbi:MAG: 3'(2'),5'-bisphosphate nucleotidase CysQ family protein [Nanoarchaeota archaeon]